MLWEQRRYIIPGQNHLLPLPVRHSVFQTWIPTTIKAYISTLPTSYKSHSQALQQQHRNSLSTSKLPISIPTFILHLQKTMTSRPMTWHHHQRYILVHMQPLSVLITIYSPQTLWNPMNYSPDQTSFDTTAHTQISTRPQPDWSSTSFP